ncbi:MAG TPA: DUF4180 domain-containing protein [Bacteroidales bacterium]|nr:DUF4180 domain-containing protein [Bacteroidales bacterium]
MKSHITSSGKKAAEASDEIFINEVQDAIDLMADLSYQGFECLILNEKNLNRDFFDLKTRFAGEILQKFSNYRFKLAVIGDFSVYSSKSLKDFIRESNKVKSIIFTNTVADALKYL